MASQSWHVCLLALQQEGGPEGERAFRLQGPWRWEPILDKAKEGCHELVLFPEAPRDMVGCSRCGGTCIIKAHLLGKPCPGHFSSQSTQRNWELALSSGYHPITMEKVGEAVPINMVISRFSDLDNNVDGVDLDSE